jgi:hypothetical protein
MRVLDFAEIGITGDDYLGVGPLAQEFAGPAWLFPDFLGDKHGIPVVTDWETGSSPPAFTPDGRLLVFGTEEGIVEVAELSVVREHLARVSR